MVGCEYPAGIVDVQSRAVQGFLQFIHLGMLSAFFIQGVLQAAILIVKEFPEILDDASDLLVVCGAFLVSDKVLNMVQGLCLVGPKGLIQS